MVQGKKREAHGTGQQLHTHIRQHTPIFTVDLQVHGPERGMSGDSSVNMRSSTSFDDVHPSVDNALRLVNQVTRYHGYCEGDDDEYGAGYFKSKPHHGFDFHTPHDHPSSGGKNRSQERGGGSSSSSSRRQEGGEAWHDKSKKKAVGVLNSGAEHVRRLVNDGFDKLKDAWENIKAAAEETAHAASRPRHW